MAGKTELIIYHRPNSGNITTTTPVGTASVGWRDATNFNYSTKLNPNELMGIPQSTNADSNTQRIDLFDDIDIPITYNIADIREPDKRKTSWSKTISIPGTKNNNIIFSHIYQISGDGWMKLGNTSIYTNFNPNIRRQIIVLSEGVQVLKGNLQLKKITKDSNNNITYDISLTGDLASLFFDVGNAKLNDLDFSEWDHKWTKQNITNSWYGMLETSIIDPITGNMAGNTQWSAYVVVSKIERQLDTGRMMITTSTSHPLVEGDYCYVWVTATPTTNQFLLTSNGVWTVAEVISATQFTLNVPYPLSLLACPTGINMPLNCVSIYKLEMSGRGYVYPMISWGDEYDANSFPVTSFSPSYFIKEIWDKIFDETNSKYQSNFLDSQFFKRLILTQKKATYDLTSAEVYSRSFLVGNKRVYDNQVTKRCQLQSYFNYNATASSATASLLYTSQTPRTTPCNLPMYIDDGTFFSLTGSFYDGGGTNSIGPGGNWDTSTNSWKVKKSGEYDLNLKFDLESWIDIDGIDQSYPPSTGVNDINWGGYAFNFFPRNNNLTVKTEIYRIRAGVRTVITSNITSFTSDYSTEYMYGGNNPQAGGTLNTNVANIYTNPTTVSGRTVYQRYQPVNWKNKNITLSPKGVFLADGDEVAINISYTNNAGPLAYSQDDGWLFSASDFVDTGGYGDYWTNVPVKGIWQLRMKGQNSNTPIMFGNVPSPKSSEGSIIYGREFLPREMTCKDFLKSIINMFNLHIEPDKEIERLYYIEPRDDYYFQGTASTDFSDWTSKVDTSSIEAEPMGALLAKYYTFSNKPEKDYWNARFFGERGREYMSYTKEIDNDFLTNESKVETSFGSTVMINNPENTDVVMPAILDKDINGSFKPSTNTLPRVLFWGGIRPYSGGRGAGLVNLASTILTTGPTSLYGWEMLSSNEITTGNGLSTATVSAPFLVYPYAGTVDSPTDPLADINWFNMQEGDFVYWDFARWSDHNLYNKYWKSFIEESTDPSSMVVTANFYLTPMDIYNLDFRRIYVVDNIWYRLQKVVDYNPVKDGLTKVELLKFKEPTKYVRSSIWGNGIFSQTVNDSRQISTVVTLKPPFKKGTRDSSYSNVRPLSNNGTIQISGQSNVVGDSRNIGIVGNECFIGDGCYNISLHGDAINVSGGLNNISVVGTSKVFIEESDVSYINGVRYKYGIPVSRCNVIDAGEASGTFSFGDVLLKKQPSVNSVINVIDAGEDVVLEIGSQTHENVIDAGSDMILPNVKELGISTTNTPQPKTNLSGGFRYQSATMSQVDIVRRNALFK